VPESHYWVENLLGWPNGVRKKRKRKQKKREKMKIFLGENLS